MSSTAGMSEGRAVPSSTFRGTPSPQMQSIGRIVGFPYLFVHKHSKFLGQAHSCRPIQIGIAAYIFLILGIYKTVTYSRFFSRTTETNCLWLDWWRVRIVEGGGGASGWSVGVCDWSWLWAGRYSCRPSWAELCRVKLQQHNSFTSLLASKKSTHPVLTFTRKSDSSVSPSTCQRICVVLCYSCLCFVIVKQLHLFAVNINEYHWLIHQPITIFFQYVRRLLPTPVPATIRTVPGPITKMKGTTRTVPLYPLTAECLRLSYTLSRPGPAQWACLGTPPRPRCRNVLSTNAQ